MSFFGSDRRQHGLSPNIRFQFVIVDLQSLYRIGGTHNLLFDRNDLVADCTIRLDLIPRGRCLGSDNHDQDD